MTENDIRLIAHARSMSYNKVDEVEALIVLADSDEAKEEIRRIAVHLSHVDEFYGGCD